ncbi:MAG: amidase family protein, partial [Candidatus Pacearchaeota archaeon]
MAISVFDFVKEIKDGRIDVIEHTHKVLEECRKINKEYHYFNNISEELALELAKEVKKNPSGRLAGVPVSIKDAICVKGVESTAGSRILEGYRPVFDATVVEKLKKEGAIIIGKTSQDEFGFGGFNINVGLGFKIPLNPFDKERTTGGSSGGCAGITQKLSFANIGIGESTGGSIVAPAGFCGVAGLCPTYGRVSRYGLIDYANSLDKIGTMAKNIKDAALALEIISGFDKNESTTSDKDVENYSDFAGRQIKGLKVGVIKEAFGEGIDKNVEKHVWHSISKLEEAGAKHEEVSLSLPIKYGIATYYLIATSEASTNLAKYCGMRYGKEGKLEGSFNEYFSKIRSENFGDEAKRRIIIGTFARMAGYRNAYYIKAIKVRQKMIEEYKRAFKKFDVLLSPTSPIIAPKIKDVEKLTPLQNYMLDILTVGPNICGLPHLSVN